jgi:hypothetical protein
MRIKRSQLKTALREELTPWLSEQTEGGLGEQVTFADYTSQNFDICPAAVTTFVKLKGIMSEAAEVDYAEDAMKLVDDLLGIEKDVVAKGFVTEPEFIQMLDFAASTRLKAGQLGAMLGRDLFKDFAFINSHILTVARMLEKDSHET